jgi:dienelactone hydrolase
VIPGGVRIFVCTAPVDLRHGFDRLAQTARERIGTEPAREGAVRARVLVCTGARDPFVDRGQRHAFEDEMTTAGAAWEIDLYAHAAHGFTEQGTSRPGCAYDRDADRRSWSSMLNLFEETLQPR